MPHPQGRLSMATTGPAPSLFFCNKWRVFSLLKKIPSGMNKQNALEDYIELPLLLELNKKKISTMSSNYAFQHIN